MKVKILSTRQIVLESESEAERAILNAIKDYDSIRMIGSSRTKHDPETDLYTSYSAISLEFY